MRELRLEELSTDQKLGLVTVAMVTDDEEQLEYILELIKNHSVGAVWVTLGKGVVSDAIKRIKEAADYPVLIMADAESGIGDLIGRHNAIACADSEELAYLFGKVTAIRARQMGYNVLCNPVLDMARTNSVCGGNARSLGGDKYRVTALASAIAKGMHDGGVLTVGKHYPGNGETDAYIDSHMAEVVSDMTEAELIEDNLYPYTSLISEGLLDGIMTKHARFPKIDPEYPASLSKKLIGIIRAQGFDGFSMTDALTMHGVVSKFGRSECIGLAVEGGNDLALAFNKDNRFVFSAMRECYEKGLISNERLDEAVAEVLKAQSKAMQAPKFTSLTEEELEDYGRLHTDGITLISDAGVKPTLSKDGRHFFIVLTDKKIDLNNNEDLDLDTFTHFWHNPIAIRDKIKEVFKASEVGFLSQFPSISDNMFIMDDQYEYDDVVFVSFFNGRPCMGRECLSARVLAVVDSLSISGRLCAVVHYGNPYVLEDFPHVKRLVIAPGDREATLAAIEVLAAEREAKGRLVYNVKLK